MKSEFIFKDIGNYFIWRPRLKKYTDISRKCEFNNKTNTVLSYGWYELIKKINGVWVLNTARYSNTTTSHYYNSKCALGLNDSSECVLYVECSGGLQNFKSESLKPLYKNLFLNEIKLTKKRLKKRHADIKQDILRIKHDIKLCRKLGAVFSRTDILTLKTNLFESDKKNREYIRSVFIDLKESNINAEELLNNSFKNQGNTNEYTSKINTDSIDRERVSAT